MIEKLHAIIHDIAERRSRQRFNAGLAAVWWLGIAAGFLLWRNGVDPRILAPVLGVILLATSILVFFWSRKGLSDPRGIAKEIETKHPELQTGLLAALDQNPTSGSFSYLQNQLVLMSLVSATRDHWTDMIPRPRITGLRVMNLSGFLLLVAVMCLMTRPAERVAPALSHAKPAAAELEFGVDPGDVEIERGTPLTIQARFGDKQPATATLETTDEAGLVQSIPLARPFTSPVYQAKLAAVAGPLEYRVVTPEGKSRAYKVTVFDLPSVRGSEVVLNFPEYLGKPPETIKDPRAIRAEEQTRMEFSLIANLPGLTASLVAKDKATVNLTPDPGDPARFKLSMILTESARYEIVLAGADGRRNSRKDILDIKVTANKAPVVKIILPRKNQKVTPIQEVRLEARTSDDSALLSNGLRYTLDGVKWEEIAVEAAPSDKNPLLSHRIDLEATGAKPKDVVMWNAWAEDIGPDGRKRRVNGDVHIVQVRDFDEELYQSAQQDSAPPPPQPGESGADPATDLIKTQTQILNSTWNLRRDHTEISITPPQAKDLETVRLSQEIAMETAAGMEAEQTDPAIRQILTDARLEMKEALAQLVLAHDQVSAAPLEIAIGHEAAALRHLYQLRSNRTMLMQSQAQGEPSSSEGEPNEDLDLKPMDNPYQSEKQARPETTGAANEAMDTLNRLDELAKRQRDLNEEMQDLQAEINQAETDERKAALERELKQLREQQKELLADVDQLRQDTADSAEASSDPAQEKALDEIREKAQQANEELGKENLGEALAAGRRAQEGLEELHDDFRETSAAQLGEQLRELRKDARAIEERQRDLAGSAAEPEAPKAPDLTDNAGSNPALTQQREELKQLLENIRETAETAEKAEPLVARDLAEALRQAELDGIAKALENMEQAPGEAASDQASEGISNLTREIEGAAERILGNEAQALRYARDELERLAEQAAGGPPDGATPGEPAGNAGEPGDPSEEGRNPGERGKPGQTAGQPGQEPGENGQPGKMAGQPGGAEQSGESQAPGSGPGTGSGEGQEPGSDPGPGSGQGQASGGEPGSGRGQGQARGEPRPGNGPSPAPGPSGGRRSGGPSAGPRLGGSPITGEEFNEWSERLSDLESIVEDPEAQSAVARARNASRELRKDFKRHAKEPDQAAIDDGVLRPLAEATKRLDDRLRELDRKDPLAPVGREPVPERYSEIVRRYFEELGK